MAGAQILDRHALSPRHIDGQLNLSVRTLTGTAVWDASVTSSGLTHCTTVLAPVVSSSTQSQRNQGGDSGGKEYKRRRERSETDVPVSSEGRVVLRAEAQDP